MTDEPIALLLDLDGVIVYEAEPPRWKSREILLLHRDVLAVLRPLGIHLAVLTHRSRREARAILAAAGMSEIPTVIGAEDLFREAWRQERVRGIWRHGLKKSWALKILEQRLGVPRRRIAFVDDRLVNLKDMLSAGLGLALHAPSEHSTDGRTMTSFDFAQIVDTISAWQRGELAEPLVSLNETRLPIADWQCSGLHTRREAGHLFNGLRTCGRTMRTYLRRVTGRAASGT